MLGRVVISVGKQGFRLSGAKSNIKSFKIKSITRNFSSVDGNDKSNEISQNIDLSSIATNQHVIDAANAVAQVSGDKPGFFTSTIMSCIDNIHVVGGLPYWEAIVVATLGLRLLMLPVAIKTVQSSARMAAMRPEMQKVQDLMAVDPHINDTRVKMKYSNEMKALFTKYKVNPLRSFIWPLAQFPVFIGMFMALRDMGTHYPGFMTGGDFWFTNLAAADPLYILPIVNSLTFLIMIEIGSDGMQMANQNTFKWVMRGLAGIMVPITLNMPSGLFVYWGVNNVVSIAQTYILKQESIRKFFDIPKPPVDAPQLKIKNPLKAMGELIENERSRGANAKAEILDGTSAPRAPPGPPPVTFSSPPKK